MVDDMIDDVDFRHEDRIRKFNFFWDFARNFPPTEVKFGYGDENMTSNWFSLDTLGRAVLVGSGLILLDVVILRSYLLNKVKSHYYYWNPTPEMVKAWMKAYCVPETNLVFPSDPVNPDFAFCLDYFEKEDCMSREEIFRRVKQVKESIYTPGYFRSLMVLACNKWDVKTTVEKLGDPCASRGVIHQNEWEDMWTTVRKFTEGSKNVKAMCN